MDLRCPHKLHAVLEQDIVEFKCSSRWCGAGPGIVVLHKFSTRDGSLIETNLYADPKPRKEVK